ncbi:MAG TPA: VOC family protein [Humisphaera sp.]|jgi:hypothetical protein|nr:VOC family protein [Humisphaera sp.]
MSVDASLMRNGGLSYLEIPSGDLRASAEFYGKVLGWKIDVSDPLKPKFADQGNHMIGRWVASLTVAREPGFMPYFYVEQIHQAVERAAGAGGQVVKSPSLEGDTIIAKLRDPSGNLIGIWEAAS